MFWENVVSCKFQILSLHLNQCKTVLKASTEGWELYRNIKVHLTTHPCTYVGCGSYQLLCANIQRIFTSSPTASSAPWEGGERFSNLCFLPSTRKTTLDGHATAAEKTAATINDVIERKQLWSVTLSDCVDKFSPTIWGCRVNVLMLFV